MVDGGGIGAGASGRNGGFLFRQPLGWINDLLAETLEIYEEVSDGPVPFDLAPWPMLVLAVEEDELEAAQVYAEAVGGEEVDLRADPWFADDLAGAFVVDGGRTLDAMGATTALAQAARREGVEFRLGCEAKRILVRGERVTGLATDEGVLPCERVVLATGPWLRLLLRSVGVDLPFTSSRGWLLETGPVDPPPRYAIERGSGDRLAPSGSASGWTLPDRHVASPLDAGRSRGARDRSPAGRPGRARVARARGRAGRRGLVGAPRTHTGRVACRRPCPWGGRARRGRRLFVDRDGDRPRGLPQARRRKPLAVRSGPLRLPLS